MQQNLFVVDAFTDKPFAGNPAGVCLLDQPADEGWMQSLAVEMRHSETAFLVKTGTGEYDLRWFTPAAEVDLCGHATLASAHVLFNHGFETGVEELRFSTHSGELRAARETGKIRLDFPASMPFSAKIEQNLQKIFGFTPKYTGISESDFLFVVAPNEQAVLDTAPDEAQLLEFSQHAIIVCAQAERGGFDVVSRMFAPQVGIYEDPVTGSAHCVLTPYWTEQLGRDELNCFQASERGGELVTRLRGERVELVGRATTIFSGTLALHPGG